jgi:hypothetical protein
MISGPIRKPSFRASCPIRRTRRSSSTTRDWTTIFYEIGLGLNAIWPQGRSGYIAYEYIGGLTGAHLNRFELGFRIEF